VKLPGSHSSRIDFNKALSRFISEQIEKEKTMTAKSTDPSETSINWNERAERWSLRQAERGEVYGPATEMMLDLAGLRTGNRVLDVACGMGDQTLLAARRVGPKGYVLATDNSSSMLNGAAEAARTAGLTNVETRLMDAENLDVGADSFDAVICRLGLMLFRSPPKALRGMHQVLKPGGKAVTLVRSTAEKNPYEGIPLAVVHRLGGTVPPMFALSEPPLLENAFRDGGFSQVAVHAVAVQRRFPSCAVVSRRIKSGGYMLEKPLAKLSEAEREQACVEIEQQLRRFEGPKGCEIPGEMLIGVGTK
jgi:SAM-dependent methyltransferase